MKDESFNELLNLTSKKRPAIIHRGEDTLESEVLDTKEEVMETEKGKYVVTQTVVRTIKRFLVVREYDPEAHYSDALKEFTAE